MKNIVLIGMPGSGKSTLGVVLAKNLNMAQTQLTPPYNPQGFLGVFPCSALKIEIFECLAVLG